MIEFQPNGCIDELNFRYNTKIEGYTNFSSDITELSEIVDESVNVMNGITRAIFKSPNMNAI